MSLNLEENSTFANDVVVASEAAEVDLEEFVEAEHPDADNNIPVPPPPAGEYDVRWKLNSSKGKNGLKFGRDKNQMPFVTVYLTGEIVAEGEAYNGYSISDYPTSVVSKLKGTSALHHFMNCINHPLDKRMTLKQIKEAVEDALSAEPISKTKIDWRASYKNSENNYVNGPQTMTKFPKEDDGTYRHWIESPIDGSNVYAQVRVVAHLLPTSNPTTT